MAERELEGFPERLYSPLLEAVRAIREKGVEVTLVGGLAVYLLSRRLPPTSGKLDDPATLGSIARGTEDIDLAVARKDAAPAESYLRALGYQRLKQELPRFERAGVVVDVLPLGGRRAEGGEFTIPIDSLAGQPAELRGVTIRVATCAELLVLKAVAWSDRHEDDDLADIGTLALIDQIQGGLARRALEEGLEGRLREDLRRDLRRAAIVFDRPDARGPGAFVREVITSRATAEQPVGVDDWEEVVRAMVSDAVRVVLSGCIANEG